MAASDPLPASGPAPYLSATASLTVSPHPHEGTPAQRAPVTGPPSHSCYVAALRLEWQLA